MITRHVTLDQFRDAFELPKDDELRTMLQHAPASEKREEQVNLFCSEFERKTDSLFGNCVPAPRTDWYLAMPKLYIFEPRPFTDVRDV